MSKKIVVDTIGSMATHADILKKFAIFDGLTEDQLRSIASFFKVRSLPEGEYLFKEKDPGESFFLVQEGSIEILKKEPHSQEEMSLTTLREGDIVGEMASLGGQERTSSAKALKTTHLLELSMEEISGIRELRDVYLHLKNKLPQIITLRVISNTNVVIEGYKRQLEHEKARSALGGFTVHLIVILFLYIFAIKTLSELEVEPISTTLISLPVLSVFAIAMLWMIKKSGYPWKSYGFTLKGAKRAVIESFLFSLPIFAIVVLYKWILIEISPSLHHLPLFQVTAGLNPNVAQPVSYSVNALLILGYATFVPVQEMVYRGAIQNALEQFLLGKHRTTLAIFISNLPFSMIHLHLSLILTVLVYFFGLFWGWLYARQRTLVGCALSHFLIGIWAFFIVGISDILKF